MWQISHTMWLDWHTLNHAMILFTIIYEKCRADSAMY